MENLRLNLLRAATVSSVVLCTCLAVGCANNREVTTETEVVGTEAPVANVTDPEAMGTAAVDQRENDPDFNHGHSISDAGSDRPDEIQRSYDVVIHDSAEALEYLEKCVPSQGSGFIYELTDTSDDDPGAYMWYRFNLSYGGEIIDDADFTVLAFTDGTIVEGWPAFLNNTVADKANAMDADDALHCYIASSGDTRQYVYKGSEYLSVGKDQTVFRYVYIYRYDCGDILKNITLKLDAETGEMVGFRADAIS